MSEEGISPQIVYEYWASQVIDDLGFACSDIEMIVAFELEHEFEPWVHGLQVVVRFLHVKREPSTTPLPHLGSVSSSTSMNDHFFPAAQGTSGDVLGCTMSSPGIRGVAWFPHSSATA